MTITCKRKIIPFKNSLSIYVIFNFFIKNLIWSHEIAEDGILFDQFLVILQLVKCFQRGLSKGRWPELPFSYKENPEKLCTARPLKRQACELLATHFENNIGPSGPDKEGKKIWAIYSNGYFWRSWWGKGDDKQKELGSFIKPVFKCDGNWKQIDVAINLDICEDNFSYYGLL